MRMKLSLTARLALLFALIPAAVLLALGLLIGQSVEHHFRRLDDATLGDALQGTQRVLTRVHSESEAHALPSLMEGVLLGHNEVGVAIFAADGGRLFASGEIAFPPALLTRAAADAGVAELGWSAGDHRYRAVAQRYASGVSGWLPVTIAVGIDVSVHDIFMHGFRVSLWLFVVCAAGLIGVLGWWAVRHALAPLHSIRKATASVTADRLSFRLDTHNVPPELAGLVASLNDMLARLEDSFRRLSDFSSDLAHELRTPLSNLMTQTQVALGKPRSEEAYREILYANVEEYERMARTIGDMLFLAKSEHGLIVPHVETVALRREAEQLCEFYGMLAEEKSVSLAVTGDEHVRGDRGMLRRALGNLLSNAIRHAVLGSAVSVALHREAGGGVCVEVCNRGATLAPEQLARVFDRFYRADASRQSGDEGAGLGLAITRSIVVAHGGWASARSDDGQTCFALHFPPAT